ncbi:ABC transporter substrate-binding protein, partial [Marinobacter adhaerens]|uniref:ABC transporter substrate-binding protein n=1 Tax=Marinobacter adhaerens TaxID=1033846 RepID=UPI003F5CE498
VLGRPLELVLYDDATNPERARTMMQRLLTQDRVSAVIGGSITPSSLAMETLASRHGVPQITMAGARILTEPVKEWLFSVTESDVMSASVIYEHMKSEGINRIALLSSSAGFGRAARETFLDEAGKYNVEVVMDETYAKGDSDMTAQLTRIRGNADVQAIINLDAGNQPAIVVRNYVALGIDAPMYTSHSMAAPEFPSLAGQAAEGVRMNAPIMLVAEQLPQSSTEYKMGVAFRELYRERYGHVPNTFAGYGHDALLLLVDAIRRAESSDPVAIRDSLEQTRDLVGLTSTLTFAPNNHGGVFEQSSSRMVEIRDGGFVLID